MTLPGKDVKILLCNWAVVDNARIERQAGWWGSHWGCEREGQSCSWDSGDETRFLYNGVELFIYFNVNLTTYFVLGSRTRRWFVDPKIFCNKVMSVKCHCSSTTSTPFCPFKISLANSLQYLIYNSLRFLHAPRPASFCNFYFKLLFQQ